MNEIERRLASAQAALERDRNSVAVAIREITKAINSYRWLIEGRGSYEWDDDEYRTEFKRAIDDIEAATSLLTKIAFDFTDCPVNPVELSSIYSDHKKGENE